MLAKFACNQNNLRGRLYQEKFSLSILSPFEVDRNRVIESNAFRRLEHKTQVFVSNEGDHYRNRLTHSLEAAQVARIISKALNISVDLAENLTLAHDIGHAPFGHAGEDALNEVMAEYGLEFDHNSHAIKLLTELEEKYPEFDGLNLTWEFLEGMAKHNGPILNPSKVIENYSKKHNLELDKYSSLESQVSALSDDIAYNNHDIDDGFRAGFISIDELKNVNMFGDLIRQLETEYPGIEEHKLVHKAVSRMKAAMIMDAIENTKANIKKFDIQTIDDVRNLGQGIASFSDSMELYHQEIKAFLMSKVYRHDVILKMTQNGKMIIKELFHRYMNDISCLPLSWQTKILRDKKEAAIVVCDFIACMSDRYAITEYRSFFE
jgi:dGTPase